MDKKTVLNALIALHCVRQKQAYMNALKKNKEDYEPKTSIFDDLSIAETEAGGLAVAELVAVILAGAKNNCLKEPVETLTDLVMALKYKTFFYDPKEEPNNEPVKILNTIYNASLDTVLESLCDGNKIPSDIADKVTDVIYK